ncbi:APC family permease [Galbitalea soli]|uniref:APC family permease n=1 Tax=Galbitalea soli TaxID=1268042 RepID=A0A7C9TMS5_9MICO|nr:APC family permease [Galbitalea soli]NEM89956.1 APC family permease [Galbitalea soli]NYJ30662.1 amino acid transporter [Galbitalea soli]
MTIPSAAAPDAATLDSKKLGLLGVMMPGLAQIAPAFNLFFTTGVMASLAGASVPLVFLISMVGMIATGLSLAQFSSLYPSAGSFITYISRSLGPRVATATGVIAIVGYIIAFGGIYIFVGSYIVGLLFPGVTDHGSVTALTIVTTFVYGAIVTVPVILGLQFGIRVTIVLYVIEVVVLVILSLAIIGQGGAQGLSSVPFTWPSGSDGQSIFLAFSLAVLAFGGFEASAPLAEETRNPRRNVPIAVVGAVVVSGIIYVLGSYAIVTAFGVDHMKQFASDGNPFATAAGRFLPLFVPIIAGVFLVSVTSSYVAANTQTSRVIFAGARGGLWPRGLSRISPRFETPWVAAIAFVVPSLIIGAISTAFTDPGTASGFLGTLGILGIVIMYIVANVALIVQYAKLRAAGVRKNPLLWVAVPIIGLVVLAIPVYGDLHPGQPAPYNLLPALAIGLVALGVIYALVLGAARPTVMANAPALLEGAEALEGDPVPPVA